MTSDEVEAFGDEAQKFVEDHFWVAALPFEMVERWTEEEIADLRKALDAAVVKTVMDHDMRRRIGYRYN